MKGNILQIGRPFWLLAGEGLEAGPGRCEENTRGTAAGGQERGRGAGAASVAAEEEKRQQVWVMFGGDGVIMVGDVWG